MDLRATIGALFVLFGCLLAAYGLLGDPSQYAASLGININLRWGLVMVLFGAAMLAWAWLGKERPSAQ